jgi:hypothetical protein
MSAPSTPPFTTVTVPACDIVPANDVVLADIAPITFVAGPAEVTSVPPGYTIVVNGVDVELPVTLHDSDVVSLRKITPRASIR